jgi:hypothetical protein
MAQSRQKKEATALRLLLLLGLLPGANPSLPRRCRALRHSMGWQVPGLALEGDVFTLLFELFVGGAGRLVAVTCPQEDDVAGGDFECRARLAVFGRVRAHVHLALHEDLPAFGKVLVADLGLATPGSHAEPPGLLAALAALAVRPAPASARPAN